MLSNKREGMELIIDKLTAKLTKKKRSNREQGKNYGFGRVLNADTLQERKGFCLFQEHQAHLSQC